MKVDVRLLVPRQRTADRTQPSFDDRQPVREHRWRPPPYLLVSILVLVLLTLIALRRPWVGDFGLHAAVIERLREDLLDPGNPQVDAEVPSPYFSPYMLVLALAARAMGISGQTALTLAAPFCAVLLLYALWRFVRVFTESRWAPVVALATVLLLWGPHVTAFSGFLALRGLPLITPYPSTLATALMLLCWVIAWTAVEQPTLPRWLSVGLLGGLIVLVHPFTAVGTLLGAVAFIAAATPRLGRAHLVGILVAATLAAAVALAWPYFSVVKIFTEASDLDPIHTALYADIRGWYGFGLALGLPSIALRLRRSPLDPLVLLSALAGAVVLYGGLSGHYAWGRVWPVLMLTLQVAVAVELTRAWKADFRRVALAVVTAIACAAGVIFQYGNLMLVLPPNRLSQHMRQIHHVVPANGYGWAERHLSSGETAVVSDQSVARILLRDGVRFVVPPWPEPLLNDGPRRVDDQRAMLDARTPEPRRHELFANYGVDWVLDSTGHARWLDQYALEIVHGPAMQRLLRIG
jgi:hypothetical protein